MLQLVGAEFGDIGGEFGIVLAQLVQLFAVVAVDLDLHRLCAGHRRFFRYQRRRCPQSKARDAPYGLQCRRADATLGHEGVEPVEMPSLLVCHARDELGRRRIAAQDRELPGIDARCAELAGLVDADHRGRVRASLAWAPGAHARRAFSTRMAIRAAPVSDRMAFQPAIEIPNSDHCTWSQRTSGALTMSCKVIPRVVVQVVKPSNIPASTPA